MLARDIEPVADGRAHDLRRDAAGIGMQRAFDQLAVGLFILAERHDLAHARLQRVVFQPLEMRVVGGQDGDAVFRHAGENLRLRVGDGFHVLEIFDVRGLDGRDDDDLGAHEGSEFCQLARMVHAHFQHGEPRVFGQVRERQRHAPMVVEAFLARMRLARRFERGGEHFLRARLAGGARDADDFRLRARARFDPQILERLHRIIDGEERATTDLSRQRFSTRWRTTHLP